jgi:hypothetical protein
MGMPGFDTAPGALGVAPVDPVLLLEAAPPFAPWAWLIAANETEIAATSKALRNIDHPCDYSETLITCE